MARAISPYVSARGKASLVDRLLASKAIDKSKGETAKQKKKMKKEYKDEVQALYDKAMREGGDVFGIPVDVLKVAGLAATFFGGPLAAGLTNAVITGAIGEEQRKASKLLLGLGEGRWAKTFLADEASGYMDKAEEQQISSSKVLTDALIAGGTAAATAHGIGGKEGLGSRITDARKISKVGGDVSQLGQPTSATVKSGMSPKTFEIPKGTPIKTGAFKGGTTKTPYTVKDPSFLAKTFPQGLTDVGPATAGGQAIKGSFANMFTQTGSKELMSKLSSLMMLPMLLKQYSR